MRFVSLGSGSKGNALLVESADTRLLIDCGFPAKELERRLTSVDVDPQTLDAILVTHEHGDHIRGVGAVARRYGLSTWMTAGTHAQKDWGKLPDLHLFHCHGAGFRIGDLEITPYTVPHDAREPCHYVLHHDQQKLGCLTDAGCITPHMTEMLEDSDALFLECNHDSQMLAEGPYPPSLQARVAGGLGHLSNTQAADLLSSLDYARLQHVVIGHVSEQNNHPELARKALINAASSIESCLSVAAQDSATSWFEL